jgi:D-amino peptidase
MKSFISVDMEGISDIVDSSMVNSKEHDYQQGRKLMAQDTNAAIQGILDTHTTKQHYPLYSASASQTHEEQTQQH